MVPALWTLARTRSVTRGEDGAEGRGEVIGAGAKTSLLSFPVVAAVVTGAVALVSIALNSAVAAVRDKQARKRDAYSRAFQVCVMYAEFPYVVRRRRKSAAEEERIRISEEL